MGDRGEYELREAAAVVRPGGRGAPAGSGPWAGASTGRLSSPALPWPGPRPGSGTGPGPVRRQGPDRA
ncbi:hypothetical protein ACFQ7S_29925, partial [Streptomyces sp. NPDC056491]